MKKLILLLMFIPFAFALNINEGDNLTQQQVNNVDVESWTLGELVDELSCTLDNAGEVRLIDHYNTYIQEFSCYDLVQTDDTFRVIRRDYRIGFRVQYFRSCTAEYERAFCVDWFQSYLKDKAKGKLRMLKARLINFQDHTETDTFSFDNPLEVVGD